MCVSADMAVFDALAGMVDNKVPGEHAYATLACTHGCQASWLAKVAARQPATHCGWAACRLPGMEWSCAIFSAGCCCAHA